MKTVRVAAAVIREGSAVFATQRGYGPWKDWWEFPGGKIEEGETPEETVVREIREELGTEIEPGEKLAQVEYDYPDFHLSMVCFSCRILSGVPVLKEHESASWLLPEELDVVRWLPADRKIIAMLKNGSGSPSFPDP
jgi:8-oxo-dGTP diphosphatase